MSLFIRTDRKLFEVSDIYVSILAFFLAFITGKIVKEILSKKLQTKTNDENIELVDPRGGELKLEISDNTELANIILTCIADNERYLVKDPEIIKVIYMLVKQRLTNTSLITLTPQFLRFLALNLLKKDQTLIVKIGNIAVSSDNQTRLLIRLVGSALLGFTGALASTLPYAILMFCVYFNITENCGYKCPDYFEQLPKEEIVKIYDHGESTGQLFIGDNEAGQQIEVFIPLKNTEAVTVINDGTLQKTRIYKKVRRKAKQITFSEFRKKDPVLSSFASEDLKEPYVSQKKCPLTDPDTIND